MVGQRQKKVKIRKEFSLGHIHVSALNFFFFLLFRVVLAAFGGCQARGPIRATAASLSHSHSNIRSELCLQFTAMLDP